MPNKLLNKNTFEQFYETVSRRLERYEISKISEDCIRYDLYSVINKIVDTEDIVLEYPNSRFIGKEIDCVIDSKKIGIEIKYFCEIPAGTLDRTQCMASFIADCYRLLYDRNIKQKIVIVLSMKSMNYYINNEKNGFSKIFDEEIKEVIVDGINNKAKHFKSTIYKKTQKNLRLKRFILRKLYLKKFDKKSNYYILAIYKVKEC